MQGSFCSKLWSRGIVFAVAWFLASQAVARPFAVPPQTMLDAEIWAQDDPNALYAWAAPILKTYDGSQISREMMIALIGARAVEQRDDFGSSFFMKVLPEMIREARSKEYWPEYLRLKAELILIRGNDRADFRADFEQLLEESNELHIKRLNRVMKTEFAEQLYQAGDELGASQWFSNAAREVFEADLGEFDRAMLQNRLAVYLDWKGQAERAEQLYRDAYQYARQSGIRSLQVAIGYNLGRLYVDQKKPETAQKSLVYFQESLQLAKELDDEPTAGMDHLGLAMAYLVLDRIEDGQEQAAKALEYFERNHVEAWISTTHIVLGRLYTKRSQYGQAVSAYEKALALVNAVDVKQVILTETELSQAYAKVQAWDKAYEHVAKARAESDKLNRQIAEKQLAEESAKMNLSMLTNDLKIKELEIKNQRDSYRFVLLISVVSMLSLVSVSWLFLRLRSRNKSIQALHDYIQKSVLTRFLPTLLVEEIIKGKSRIESKPREELVTVLFSDIVDFTALSSHLGAGDVSDVLHVFMSEIADVIDRHQGTIDKFIGDSVMVIFGAPLPLPADVQARRAMACARDMLDSLRAINARIGRERGIEIRMRIGINQGPAIVGIFGSEKRSDYTAIGPTVNIASRIEGKAGSNEIWISPQLVPFVEPSAYETRGRFKLKGITDEMELYALKPGTGVPSSNTHVA